MEFFLPVAYSLVTNCINSILGF